MMVDNLLKINKHLNIDFKDEINEFLDKASNPDLNKIELIAKEAYERNEIPKIIHFCFVNYKDVSDIYYVFFKQWKDMFDDSYTFVNWTPKLVPENYFTEICLRDAAWAFYADFARVFATYNYGGFYLDADVWVYKNFDELLSLPYVFDIEHSCLNTIDKRLRLEAGVFGVQRHNSLIKVFLDFYQSIKMQPSFDYGSLIAPFLWNDLANNAGFNILYNYGDFVAIKKALSLNNDEKTIYALNGEYLSKTETNLPNRFLLGKRSGIIEQHHTDCAFTSHQFLSNWC